ncbi:MAG: hypothetical protein LBQ66_15785 [Planctomycetaceae bacterium]|jgi:hypothetical protein|nr:hypothetical protein [Planctomycetaceae bacterium]
MSSLRDFDVGERTRAGDCASLHHRLCMMSSLRDCQKYVSKDVWCNEDNARRNNLQTRFGTTQQSSISLRHCREWIHWNRLHRALPDAMRLSPFAFACHPQIWNNQENYYFKINP